MTDLVSICAPCDGPDGAPLVFDRDAPGHCRWGTPVDAAAIALAERLAAVEQRLAQVMELAKLLERDNRVLRHMLESHEHDIKRVA